MRRFLPLLLILLLSVAAIAEPNEEVVSYNTKSGIYHCRTCNAAKNCRTNCIDLPLSEAIARGGVACRLCGGSCG